MRPEVAKLLADWRAARKARPKRKRKAVPEPSLHDPKAGRAWKASLVEEFEDAELEAARAHAFTEKAEARIDRAECLACARGSCEKSREKLKTVCRARRDRCRVLARQRIEAAGKAERQARKDRQKNRRLESERTKRWKRGKSIEAIGESDAMVRGEIEAIDRALLPLWERIKRGIKGSPKKSRAEAFFHYVHENPEEAQRVRFEAAPTDEELAAEQAAYWARKAG